MSYTAVRFDLAVAEAKRWVAEFDALANDAGEPDAAEALVEALVDRYGLDDIAHLVDQHREAESTPGAAPPWRLTEEIAQKRAKSICGRIVAPNQ